MRYGPDDKFWVVIDPKDNCELEDIIFQASLQDLHLQFKGGTTPKLKVKREVLIMTRARFTREGHRFVVRDNSVRVYKRVDEGYYSNEFAVSPQKRTGMVRKYMVEVEAARNLLQSYTFLHG